MVRFTAPSPVTSEEPSRPELRARKRQRMCGTAPYDAPLAPAQELPRPKRSRSGTLHGENVPTRKRRPARGAAEAPRRAKCPRAAEPPDADMEDISSASGQACPRRRREALHNLMRAEKARRAATHEEHLRARRPPEEHLRARGAPEGNVHASERGPGRPYQEPPHAETSPDFAGGHEDEAYDEIDVSENVDPNVQAVNADAQTSYSSNGRATRSVQGGWISDDIYALQITRYDGSVQRMTIPPSNVYMA